MRTTPSRRRRGGFTLIEVLLVLVILVTIGSLAVGVYLPIREQADISAAKVQISAFKGPIGTYQLNVGSLPQQLEDLHTPPSDSQKWHGPYFEAIPDDPWGTPYQYETYEDENGHAAYQITSAGPLGTFGDDDDISNLDQENSRGSPTTIAAGPLRGVASR